MSAKLSLWLSLASLGYQSQVQPLSWFSPKVPQTCTIVIAPTGDASHASLQLSQLIKADLQRQRNLEVVIAPEAPVKLANQLAAQFFVSLTVLSVPTAQASCACYYYSRQRFSPQLTHQPWLFYPLHDIYRLYSDQTSNWAHKISAYLAQNGTSLHVTSAAPIGCPYRPLLGVNAPAVGLELALPATPADLANYAQLLSESLLQCVQPTI